MMSRTSLRILVPLLLLAGHAACGRDSSSSTSGPSAEARDQDEAVDEGGIGDPDRDSATLRAAGMHEWYTESKTTDREGGIWSRDYRAYLLDAARAERLRWSELMPGARSPAIVGGSQWTSLGPTSAKSGPNGGNGAVVDSGRISAIIPDGTRLYVATAGGGVWRREGGAWKALTETVGTLSCGALAMDPSNHDHLYLGLGDAFDGTGIGVLTSSDGGDNWSDPVFLGDSMIIPQIIVDPSTTSIVLAATDKGLYRSTNSGASWSLVNIATGFTTPTRVWSIASTGAHSFAISVGTLAADSSITTDGQVWTSSNDGATWTQSTGIAQASVGRITVASAASSPQTVYAMAATPSSDSSNDLFDIFKSTNGGASWTALGVANKSYSNDSSSVGSLLNGQGWYNQLVLVDPTNANIAYFGGALLLAKTSDGGSTFREMSDWTGSSGLPYVHADFHAGAIDSSGLYVGTDGGIFQSTNAGVSFSNSLNTGLVTHLLYSVGSSPAAPNAVIGGMQDNGTRLRESTTSTFDEVIGGDGFGAAINRTNGQKMLGSLYYDDIRGSSNGGQSWNSASNGIAESGDQNNAPFITRIVAWEGKASTGNEVYTFSNTKVYKSTSFGSSWTALPAAVTTTAVIRNMNVAATDAKILGVVASGGGVFLSKDGGTSWTTVANGKGTDTTALPNSDRSLSWIQFDVTNPNTVYVSSVAPEASVNHLWKSTDFGAHWASIDGNGLPAGVPVNLIKSDPVPDPNAPDKVLYAGTHMGVYRSTDGGATWSRFGAGMPLVSVMDLYISPDESIVRAATFGRGFWELSKPANDFSMTANPTAVSVAPGASGATTITDAVTAGAAQAVALSVSGLPPGSTGVFAPTTITGAGTSTLTLTAGAATPGGTYHLTVTGTGTFASHMASVTFTVAGGPDFSISASPDTVAIAPGASGVTTIATAVTAGAAQNVALTVDGLPAGVTAAFAPTSVSAGDGSTLTLTADATTAAGTYPLTITGTGTSAAHAATVTLDVIVDGSGIDAGVGGDAAGSGSGNGGDGGSHAGCNCAAGGGLAETSSNFLLGLAVFGLGFSRRRRRGGHVG